MGTPSPRPTPQSLLTRFKPTTTGQGLWQAWHGLRGLPRGSMTQEPKPTNREGHDMTMQTLIKCPNCGSTNMIPSSETGVIICGNCGHRFKEEDFNEG